MLVLTLNHQLHQRLLTHYLLSRGIAVTDENSSCLSSTVVLMTDKFPPFQPIISTSPQIWLLDGRQAVPTPLPLQVKGLLMSDCDLTELELCIRQVMRQQSYVSPSLLNLLTKPTEETFPSDGNSLTSREREVFELIKVGLSIREIAERLFISPHTAENHRANIQRKMALTGRLSLVRYAASVQNPVK